MSNITYLNGNILLYYHITNPLSLSYNNSWLCCHNYHLPDCFQQPYFLPLPTGRAYLCIQICVIISLVRNSNFWPFTFIINLFQPLYLFIWKNWSSRYLNVINIFTNVIIRITLLLVAQCTVHIFGLPIIFIFLDWYIRLILLFFLIIRGHHVTLQDQPPPLISVHTLWTWTINGQTTEKFPIVKTHVHYGDNFQGKYTHTQRQI